MLLYDPSSSSLDSRLVATAEHIDHSFVVAWVPRHSHAPTRRYVVARTHLAREVPKGVIEGRRWDAQYLCIRSWRASTWTDTGLIKA